MRGTRVAGCILFVAATAQAEPKAATHVLELGSVRVEAVDGSVTSEKGGDGIIAKPAAGKHDEITVKGGAALARDLAPILGEGLTKDCPRNVNGSFALVGGDGNELARLAFGWAVLTELGMPALDAAGGPGGETTLKIEPQFPRRVFQKGAVAKPPPAPNGSARASSSGSTGSTPRSSP